MNPDLETGNQSVFPTLDELDDAALRKANAENVKRAAYLGLEHTSIAPCSSGRLAQGHWSFRIRRTLRGNINLKIICENVTLDDFHYVFVNERLLHISRGETSPLCLFKVKAGICPNVRIIIANSSGIVPHKLTGHYWASDLSAATAETSLLESFLEQSRATKRKLRNFYEEVGNGGYLSKKGSINPPKFQDLEKKKALGNLYTRVCSTLWEGLGLTMFASHGTLLGLIREGDLIEHDDDFDCAYLSAENDLTRVSLERFTVADHLTSKGFHCRIGINGNLRVFQSEYMVMIDLMPSWIDENHFNVSSYTSIMMKRDDLTPFAEVDFHGAKIKIPKEAEKFLELNYGPSWKVPDPSYRTVPGKKAMKIRRKFKRDQLERQDLLC